MFYRNFCIQCKQCSPDQTPQSEVSYLGLHCLPITIFGVSRLKGIKMLVKTAANKILNQIHVVYFSEKIRLDISCELSHYENAPIQIYRKFHLQNLKIFR